MEVLSKTEELILLTVWRLKDEAYGVTIRKNLNELSGKNFSIGGVYVPLDRLVRKGFLDAYQGEPTAERGGMSKRYYTITKEGIKAVNESRQVYENLWDGLKTTN